MLVRLFAVSIIPLLCACAAKDTARFKEAAVAPLNDLNLVQPEIPPLLLAAKREPYATETAAGCEAMADEIWELDAILGPDLDAERGLESEPDLLDRGAEEVKKAAVGAVRRTTEGLVPFRGWVRKLSGAERRSDEVAAAIAAGKARRAFLKGLRVSRMCDDR